MPYYKKKDDNTLVQPTALDIQIEHSVEGLRKVLEMGADMAESQYSQFDLVAWCEAFSFKMSSQRDDLTSADSLVLNIAEDVHGTWSIYIINNFTQDVLLKTDVDDIRMPESYWRGWLSILSANIRKE